MIARKGCNRVGKLIAFWSPQAGTKGLASKEQQKGYLK